MTLSPEKVGYSTNVKLSLQQVFANFHGSQNAVVLLYNHDVAMSPGLCVLQMHESDAISLQSASLSLLGHGMRKVNHHPGPSRPTSHQQQVVVYHDVSSPKLLARNAEVFYYDSMPTAA